MQLTLIFVLNYAQFKEQEREMDKREEKVMGVIHDIHSGIKAQKVRKRDRVTEIEARGRTPWLVT